MKNVSQRHVIKRVLYGFSKDSATLVGAYNSCEDTLQSFIVLIMTVAAILQRSINYASQDRRHLFDFRSALFFEWTGNLCRISRNAVIIGDGPAARNLLQRKLFGCIVHRWTQTRIRWHPRRSELFRFFFFFCWTSISCYSITS